MSRSLVARLVLVAGLATGASARAQTTAAPLVRPDLRLTAPLSLARVPALRTRMGTAKLRPIEGAVRDLATALRREMAAAARGGTAIDPRRPPAGVTTAARAYLERYATATGEASADRMVEDAAALAVATIQDDVGGLDQSVRTLDDARTELRAVVAMLRDHSTAHAPYPLTFSYPVLREGSTSVFETVSRTVASETELNSVIAEIQRLLETLSDLSTELNLQLRQRMQEYSQAVMLLSTLLKSMHDTAMSIINNLK